MTTPTTTPDLTALRQLAAEWKDAGEGHHPDDYLRGYAQGMSDAGAAILGRLGGES